jgi:hypothetical protein
MRFLPSNLRGNKPFNVEEHFRQTRSGVLCPDNWQISSALPAAALWILSRGCYAVRTIELAAVPAPKREAAIQLAIAGWQPFANTAHYVIPNGPSVQLCAWDANETARLADEISINSLPEVVPEGALRQMALEGDATSVAAHLVSALDGCVGMVSSKGRALAEQWWPASPTSQDWKNFLRSAGLETTPDAAPPPIRARQWRQAPLGYPASRRSTTTTPAEIFGVWLVAVVLAVPTIWYANDLRQIVALKRSANERLAATEKDLDAVLTARESALAAQDRATKLAELLNQTDQLQLFAAVNNVLTQIDAQASLQLADWEVRAQQLKFALIATGPPPAATVLVKALERVPTFRDVEAKVDGSRINVTLRLLPPEAGQVPAAGPSAPALTQPTAPPPALKRSATVGPTTPETAGIASRAISMTAVEASDV